MSQPSRRFGIRIEMKWSEQLIIVLIIAAILLVYVIGEQQQEKVTSEAAVTRGSGALSLDRLTKFAESSEGDLKIHAWRKPTNFAQDLPADQPSEQTLMFLGLRMRPSVREMKLLEEFLPQAERQIIFAGHDDPSEFIMENFAAAMGLRLDLRRNSNFENFAPVRITSTVNDWPFREGEVYEFYSRTRFLSPACQQHPVHCYIRVAPWHKAQTVFMAGVPIFSNAMLGREDNAKLALRILEGRRQVYVDEYHHYFSERTWWDLAREPMFAFAATLFGLALLLYAFFGSLPRIRIDDSLVQQKKDGSRSGENALAFGRRVIQGVAFDGLTAEAQRLLRQNVRRRSMGTITAEPSASADLPTWIRWYRKWLTSQKYVKPSARSTNSDFQKTTSQQNSSHPAP
jgi:hypothetical protein